MEATVEGIEVVYDEEAGEFREARNVNGEPGDQMTMDDAKKRVRVDVTDVVDLIDAARQAMINVPTRHKFVLALVKGVLATPVNVVANVASADQLSASIAARLIVSSKRIAERGTE